jgi:sec-independent protein translocase protein TatB
MLDIGFSELVLIGVVALVVIGPERLPRVARTAGHLLGRFQRYVAEVKADINREMELAELKKIQTSVEDAARSIEHSVKTGMDDAQKEFRDARAELDDTAAALKKTEDALKDAVSSAQLPHMGTAGPGSDQLARRDDGSPAGAEVPPGLVPAIENSGSLPTTLPVEASAAVSRGAERVANEDTSPQLELALDPGGESTDRKQA